MTYNSHQWGEIVFEVSVKQIGADRCLALDRLVLSYFRVFCVNIYLHLCGRVEVCLNCVTTVHTGLIWWYCGREYQHINVFFLRWPYGASTKLIEACCLPFFGSNNSLVWPSLTIFFLVTVHKRWSDYSSSSIGAGVQRSLWLGHIQQYRKCSSFEKLCNGSNSF